MTASPFFRVLTDLGWPTNSVDDFLRHGFFLTHTAKCAIKGTWKPSKPVSLFCASRYLKREIEALSPRAICWLSKGVGLPVAQSLADDWDGQRILFGKTTILKVKETPIPIVVTK